MYFSMRHLILIISESNFETLISDAFDVISETKEVTLECILVYNIPF